MRSTHRAFKPGVQLPRREKTFAKKGRSQGAPHHDPLPSGTFAGLMSRSLLQPAKDPLERAMQKAERNARKRLRKARRS